MRISKGKPVLNVDMLSQSSSDFRVKEFILDLFRRGYHQDKIQSKILKFFKAYDLSRDGNIDSMQKKLDTEKKTNSKIKNSMALDHSDKTEIENLFLDCVDECKKEVLRKKTIASRSQLHAGITQSNESGQALIEQIVLNKESLLGVFEEMFGNKNINN